MLPSGSVAVAVTAAPEGSGVASVTVKLWLPDVSVVTFVVPTKVSPSPFPEESQGATPEFEKISIRKVRPAALFSVPETVFPTADVISGKFCRRFARRRRRRRRCL